MTIGNAGRAAGVMPAHKYRSFPPVDLSDRSWPNRCLSQPPRWCSVDLRDGNQALIDPMSPAEKMEMYQLLLDIGFSEIEVGFPAASQPDFDFIRRLIDEDRIPPNVTVQVLCQAREELIERTCAALEGVPRAIFHLYNSTSQLQRRVVFGMDRAGVTDLAVKGCRLVREGIERHLPGTDVTLEYSPESFTGTELDFAVEICEAVAGEWGIAADRPVIINLPSTVEMATPNVYADQVEWFCRSFRYRDAAVVSLHTHNDRGTGVAATELALMAGADRVEGTLFGNGERTGNCDIITVAMNLFSQGVDPQLDLRDMPRIRTVAESITRLPVPERHPYAGDLVFTAFSGSHQDAIRKGMEQVDFEHWEVPYLPIDPADVGSSYKETVRVNSQSGKAGVGFVLEQLFGVDLPREMLLEFSKIVQERAEGAGREVRGPEIWDAFDAEYLTASDPYQLTDYALESTGDQQVLRGHIRVNGNSLAISGQGTGPIDAFVNGLEASINERVEVFDYHEHSMDRGRDAKAICLLAICDSDGGRCYGAGASRNTVTASLEAVVSALNRRWKRAS